MGEDLLGQTCALLAALTWATAVVLFKRSGEHVSPLALNLFKSTIGLTLLIVTLVVTRDGFAALERFPRSDILILLFSGLVGIALADTIFFHSLNLIGVGLVSVVDCLYSPFVILFSCLMLAEELSLFHYVGTGLILTGVLISSRHAPPADRTRGQLLLGMCLAAVAIAMMAFGIVLAKPVLDVNDFPLMWATMLRLLAGTFVLALFALASPQRKTHWAAFRPSAIWKFSLPASVLGNYLAMIFWVAGFKYTRASIAGILNQTSIIFAIILATIILNERFTRRKLLAIILAFAGVAIITVYGT